MQVVRDALTECLPGTGPHVRVSASENPKCHHVHNRATALYVELMKSPHREHAKSPRARITSWLLRQWQKRGVAAWLLWPFSLVFGALAALRRIAFRRGWRVTENAGVPIIIVGNLTLGGTGKTPTVIALVEALRARGFEPGVVSRGYGSDIVVPTPVTAQADAARFGDEPTLIVYRTGAPMWVCPNRSAAARALRMAHPRVDVIISDDGLQHYALARDVELVVFDQRLGGNGFLLPAGPLREPLSRRRDATLINGATADNLPCWPNTFALELRPRAAWRLTDPKQRRPLASFASERLAAVAGIGHPQRFFSMLGKHGLTPTLHALPDHYDYAVNPFTDLAADAILVTEKDAVKCAGWRDTRLWAVPVDAVLEPRLIELVVEKLRGCTST